MESQENKDNICIVCHKNPIGYRVMPCRHGYLCKKCSMKMASGGKCKICHEFFVECKRILPGEALNPEDEKEKEKDEDKEDNSNDEK